MIIYYLDAITKNAQTGETKAKLAGPYVASILASYRREVSDDEVQEYVKRMHGAYAEKIERIKKDDKN
jgi:predicted Zn-dependent protease